MESCGEYMDVFVRMSMESFISYRPELNHMYMMLSKILTKHNGSLSFVHFFANNYFICHLEDKLWFIDFFVGQSSKTVNFFFLKY